MHLVKGNYAFGKNPFHRSVYDDILVQIISPHKMYLNPNIVVKQYEFWQLITNFFFFGKMGNFCSTFFLNGLKKSNLSFNRKYRYCFECLEIFVHCFILSLVFICQGRVIALQLLQLMGQQISRHFLTINIRDMHIHQVVKEAPCLNFKIRKGLIICLNNRWLYKC